MFQFLIGIINPRCDFHRYYKSLAFTRRLWNSILVSIPHRYYKSKNKDEHILEYRKFQFLIGIINPNGTVKVVIVDSKFQFLIGIINPYRVFKNGHYKILFQFLIGIINPFISISKPPNFLMFQFLIGIINPNIVMTVISKLTCFNSS